MDGWDGTNEGDALLTACRFGAGAAVLAVALRLRFPLCAVDDAARVVRSDVSLEGAACGAGSRTDGIRGVIPLGEPDVAKATEGPVTER